MERAGQRHHILFYTRKGCHLCDDARDIVRRVQKDFLLDLQEVDTLSDQSLHDRYKEIIPVMVIDGQITLGARVEEEELRDALMEVESTNRTGEVRKS